MSVSLADALRADTANTIAFTGSGGKTTAIFQLARESKTPAIVTATSHMGVWQLAMADRHIVANDSKDLSELIHSRQHVTLITGAIAGDRTKPISREVLEGVRKFCSDHSLLFLIEADGSRQKPLKAWADHEPPIPDFVDMVVQVVGLNGVGKPLTEEFVHRTELFAEKGGLTIGSKITSEVLVRFLLHPNNPWDRIPISARHVILLNQADEPTLQSIARGMAHKLLSRFHSVIIACLKQNTVFAVHEPVAGVILAAGGSARFGEPKQLLDWHGEPFVRVVARKALEAGLSPVIVVTGANADKVELTVNGLNVRIVRNVDWKSGQAGSIKAGLRIITTAEGSNAGACIFLLADQPHITTSILHALMEKHADGLHPVLVPMVMDRRANPVLFDRITFPNLLSLEGDFGGRAIFHNYRVEYLPWHDDRLLLDVDTPEQYQRLMEDETL
jgi:molybdenum cofactor cytidylyltransferase